MRWFVCLINHYVCIIPMMSFNVTEPKINICEVTWPFISIITCCELKMFNKLDLVRSYPKMDRKLSVTARALFQALL